MRKIAFPLILAALLATTAVAQVPNYLANGQVLRSDWWSAGGPVNGVDFVLYNGNMFDNPCAPLQTASGFSYGQCGAEPATSESISVQYTGPEGGLFRYTGTVGKITVKALDTFACYLVSFPVSNGVFQFTSPTGGSWSAQVPAKYAQVFCDGGGDAWWAAGDLTVEVSQQQ
ncbi:MAG: hypothetical protein WBQ43_17050 [Terriglobales bacterium]